MERSIQHTTHDNSQHATPKRATHDIEVVTRAGAHDFMWKHFRAPYELCVFELDNDSSYAYIWPYLIQYGGVLLLRSLTLHDSRAHARVRERRRYDYADLCVLCGEFVFVACVASHP